jgi:hypothetical protein
LKIHPAESFIRWPKKRQERFYMKGLLAVIVLFAVWPFSSGKEFHMTPSTGVPAATGTVKVQKDNQNKNTRLEIKVYHLASPSNLTPPASVYVVWVRPNGGEAIKQGALRVDEDLKGELDVVTTSKNCDVFITAEQGDTVTVPSEFTVLQTHVTTS